MNIEEARQQLDNCESKLDYEELVEFATFETGETKLRLYLSATFRKRCKKKKVWKSKAFFITLKNAKYGLDPLEARSRGGKDGLFMLDRNFSPKNAMQKKVFDQFMDKPSSSFAQIVKELNLSTDKVKAVRIVSHHMRLLGIYQRIENVDTIILVDFDNTK
ncbi:MAG: hypothetical protein MK212_10200 [Saprospiraceae bacterium]|nr:hypothetical protein [Saprospiraceae bacterium]